MLTLDIMTKNQISADRDMRVSKLWSFYKYPWISREFSDCGLHNGKYTKNQPIGNCVFRALTFNY
jgi:hypothetical protein